MLSTLLLIVLILFFIRRVYFSPLTKIPGPKLAALTSLYYTYHEFKGDRHLFIDSLHHKYGPIVRIGPNYVAISDTAAVKEIYGVGSWDKPRGGWYTHFSAYGEDNMFSVWEGKEHLRRKKVISSMYKKTFLLTKPNITDILERNTGRLVEAINDAITAHTEGGEGPLDIYILLHRYATDVIAEFTYGPDGNTNSLISPKYRYVAEEFALSDRRANQLCQIHIPFLTKIWTRIQKMLKTRKEMGVFEYGWHAVQNMKAEKVLDAEESLASLMMSNKQQFSDAYIASELFDHMVAGSDTTANTLTYLLHELSRPQNIDIQRRLHGEIMSSPNATLSDIDKLSLLDAVVREGLRVFSAIPFLEPREVPQGGRVLQNHFLPEQTTVGTQAYTLHHDESVFADCNSFNPDRWLTTDEEHLKIMNRSFWAFGSGQRGCIAEHLAWLEMKIAVMKIYEVYATGIAPGFKDEEMVLDDQISSIVPIGRRCLLTFQPWS